MAWHARQSEPDGWSGQAAGVAEPYNTGLETPDHPHPPDSSQSQLLWGIYTLCIASSPCLVLYLEHMHWHLKAWEHPFQWLADMAVLTGLKVGALLTNSNGPGELIFGFNMFTLSGLQFWSTPFQFVEPKLWQLLVCFPALGKICSPSWPLRANFAHQQLCHPLSNLTHQGSPLKYSP